MKEKTDPFPGLGPAGRKNMTESATDWSGLGVDPDAELWAAKERYPDLTVRRGVLRVTSPNITIHSQGRSYDFGPYEIAVKLPTRKDRNPNPYSSLRVYSTRTDGSVVRHGSSHPHVSASGYGCWGEMEGPYKQAYCEGRWGDLLDLVCAMLSTCSGGHEYYLDSIWPDLEIK